MYEKYKTNNNLVIGIDDSIDPLKLTIKMYESKIKKAQAEKPNALEILLTQ